MREIVFATTSKWKMQQAERFLAEYSISPVSPPGSRLVESDLYIRLPGGSDEYSIEIQSDSMEEIARYKAFTAANVVGGPVLVEDAGVRIDALKGFPGPYTKYAILTIGLEGILRLMADQDDRRAEMISAVGYCAPGEDPKAIVGVLHGSMSTAVRARPDNPWRDALLNPLFVPAGTDLTLAEMMPDEVMAMRSYPMRSSLSEFGAWYAGRDVVCAEP